MASLALAALAAGCNTEYDNPFQSGRVGVAPPAAADVIFTSSGYSNRPGSPREVFAVEDAGSSLTRITFCNTEPHHCDNVEAAPAPERERMVVRRVSNDANGDGRLTSADGEALVFLDLARGVEVEVAPASRRVSGVDWSPLPQDAFIIYSAAGEGGYDDLWTMDPNGQNNRNRTLTPTVAERRPRLNVAANSAVYERIEAGGKGQIFIFSTFRVTTGGPGTEPLPGTPYVVGSDADPVFSPDGRQIAFRRLTGVGNGGLGTWDVLTVRTDGTELAVVASGPAYRGAPDWGTRGILFNEVDVAAGTSQLVWVDADGTHRRTPVSLAAVFEISYPRWLPTGE